MSSAKYLRAAILISVLVAAGVFAKPPQKEVTVWALTETKVYHCPKSKLYKIGNGKEMSECEAIREGYKPALVSCGSNCR
ncbi:MAG TPA: hypothetical protein VLV88_15445 [Terriglobales bacterium]|nr:hypothetical protein [Terriglobales bacterium]